MVMGFEVLASLDGEDAEKLREPLLNALKTLRELNRYPFDARLLRLSPTDSGNYYSKFVLTKEYLNQIYGKRLDSYVVIPLLLEYSYPQKQLVVVEIYDPIGDFVVLEKTGHSVPFTPIYSFRQNIHKENKKTYYYTEESNKTYYTLDTAAIVFEVTPAANSLIILVAPM